MSHRKPKPSGKKRLHWPPVAVPARPVRSTRAGRNDEHKARMTERRQRQLARTSSYPLRLKLRNGTIKVIPLVRPSKSDSAEYRRGNR